MKKKDIITKWSSDEYLESISKYLNSIVNNQPDIAGVNLSGIIIGPETFNRYIKK